MSRGKLPTLCPNCKGTITVSPSKDSLVGWSCGEKCGAFGFAEYDHPEITKGKRLAKEFSKANSLDKRITCLSTNAQIGILRVRQHPKENQEYL